MTDTIYSGSGDDAASHQPTAGRHGARPTVGPRARAALILNRIGETLLRAGEFKAAEMACRCAVKADSRNIEGHLYLSALQHSGGKRQAARETLERGIRRNPVYSRSVPPRPLARVMTVQGIEDGYFMVQTRRNKEFKVALRGGNFSDRYLIDRDKFALTNFFILGDNILSCALPEFDIIVNTIADPDREPQALTTLCRFLDADQGLPVINDPERVVKTTRDNNYRRLKDSAGVLMPKTVRSAGRHAVAADVTRLIESEGLSFPVLVREAGSHTGMTLRKFDSREQLANDFTYANARELYVTQFHDCRFRGDYFRKMRLFFIDGKMFPVVCHIDTVWNVHGDNRKTIMLKNAWTMDEERAFMADPRAYLGAGRYQTLHGLYREIGLDFFGVDFTVTDDGRILIYEVNPVMIHKFDHAGSFPYLTPYLEAISDAFNAMIENRVTAGAGRRSRS